MDPRDGYDVILETFNGICPNKPQSAKCKLSLGTKVYEAWATSKTYKVPFSPEVWFNTKTNAGAYNGRRVSVRVFGLLEVSFWCVSVRAPASLA